jgi:hypothetical protein
MFAAAMSVRSLHRWPQDAWAWGEYALDLLVFAEAGTVARPMPSRIDAATAVNICSFFEFITSSLYNVCS